MWGGSMSKRREEICYQRQAQVCLLPCSFWYPPCCERRTHVPARGQPTMSPCAKDSFSLWFSLSLHCPGRSLWEKEMPPGCFYQTSLLLFLNREILVKRAKSQGHQLRFKKLQVLGFMACCGNGCSERELLSGVWEIALSRLWEEDN